jgi:hypothetical protein
METNNEVSQNEIFLRVILIIALFIFPCASLFLGYKGAQGFLMTKEIINSPIVEYGRITKTINSHRSIDETVYFTLLSDDNKVYRINLFKLLFDGDPDDLIKILFNENKTFWVIEDYLNASYATFISYLIGCGLFLVVSCLVLKALVEIKTV